MSVEITNLTKTYGSQKAIDSISFKVNTGEIVGFLGPNGAGKSTTLKIITGFLEADKGTVLVSGTNVSEHPIEAKKKIGYLPEANPLYNEMYIREYLEFIGSLHQLTNLRNKVENVISLTGLSLESNKKIGQISKGYKQRTGLAAALIHDPEVLILDEPTSGLDPNQIAEIREVIKKLGKNKTVLFSSHILQEVEAICDRVIIINKGKIVANNSLSKLRENTNNESNIIVQFDDVVQRAWFNLIPSAQLVEPLENNKWLITSSSPIETKNQILQLSLQHNLNIVSLHSETNSLEQIFKNLTS
ncbi:MAG: gliding motility-associated ABC transporter ATP-binding subunit GldA [Ginsengibacter sp.]